MIMKVLKKIIMKETHVKNTCCFFLCCFGLISCSSDNNNTTTDTPSQTQSETTSSNAWSGDNDWEDYDIPESALMDYELATDLYQHEKLSLDLSDGFGFDADLSPYSYEELRVLKAYPYACHGHWFKESDLNKFYMQYKWYEDVVDTTLIEYPAEELKNWNDTIKKDDVWFRYAERDYKTTEYVKEYLDMWNSDYEKTYSLIPLTLEEKKFVSRIDSLMSKMKENKYVNVGGVDLLNSSLAVNGRYIANPNDATKRCLKQCNFFMRKTNLEQLFNIYETNWKTYTNTPSFVTTDLYLQVYHMYFTHLLNELESKAFVPHLSAMVDGMLQSLPKDQNQSDIMKWHDFFQTYFAVASYLLNEKKIEVPSSMKSIYEEEIKLVESASAFEESPLLGKTKIPYMLFKPRGNYTSTEEKKRYFRSMMWLQTICFIMGKEGDMQKSLYLAYAYRHAPESVKEHCRAVFDPVTFLMGEPNNISIVELADMLESKLNIKTLQDIVNIKDFDLVMQKINDHFGTAKMINKKDPTRKIAFMPSRFVIDNYVLTNMVDSTINADFAFPRGIDVFDALGSPIASSLVEESPVNKTWNDFDKTRADMKKYYENYSGWNNTMYSKWLESLVVLQQKKDYFPNFMKTKEWGKKNLNTSLASWAELKHDAILYTEQPLCAEMGGGEWLELPSPVTVAYLEPNLPFWEKMREMLILNNMILKKINFQDEDIEGVTKELMNEVDFCILISQKEIKGEKLTDEEYKRINFMGSLIENLTYRMIKGPIQYEYMLWSDIKTKDRSMPVIADIFTRHIENPELCPKNGALYAGVGYANELYVLVEINGEVYVTRGASFSYYEFVRSAKDRLTDEQWNNMLHAGKYPSVPDWISPLMCP